jgi:hypothetical protein
MGIEVSQSRDANTSWADFRSSDEGARSLIPSSKFMIFGS